MITQVRLKELFHYCPYTGDFTRRVTQGNRGASGSKAGCVCKYGVTSYKRIQIDGRLYYSHRLAWLYVNGEFPDCQIDHADGNGLNNAIANLRDVTHQENRKNMSIRSDNTSGITGVFFDRRRIKWVALIRHEGKNMRLGFFNTIEEAAFVRKEAEIKYGYYENHGRKPKQQLE